MTKITGSRTDDWICWHFGYCLSQLQLLQRYRYNSTKFISAESQSHISTDGQSVVSLGVQPHLGLMTRYVLLFDSYGLAFVGRPL
jgi:hypothetical protein